MSLLKTFLSRLLRSKMKRKRDTSEKNDLKRSVSNPEAFLRRNPIGIFFYY